METSRERITYSLTKEKHQNTLEANVYRHKGTITGAQTHKTSIDPQTDLQQNAHTVININKVQYLYAHLQRERITYTHNHICRHTHTKYMYTNTYMQSYHFSMTQWPSYLHFDLHFQKTYIRLNQYIKNSIFCIYTSS